MCEQEKEKVYILEVKNQVKHLKYGTYLIGRNTENISHDIAVDDASVDIKHAILSISQNEISMIDLFSKNGTYVNNKLIPKAKYFQIHHDTTQSSSSLTFGNVKGIFRFSSPLKEDNGDDMIIPNSPERSVSQKSSRSKFLHIGNSASILNIKKSRTDEKSLLTASTQVSSHKLDISQYDESIRKNIELLEEEDDFYIPETQQVFNRTYKDDIKSDLKQSQKHNRIFDENESMIRICTQDFNAIEEDEETVDSDDLLRNIDLDAIENVTMNETRTPLEKDDLLKKTDREQSKNKGDVSGGNNKRNTRVVDDDVGETDCEEEMSTLRWHESLSNKTKSTNVNDGVVTPDLEIINKSMEPEDSNKNEENTKNSIDDNRLKSDKNQLGSRSTTPDLDMILNKQEINNKSGRKKILPINKFPSVKDDECNDTQMLIATQIFTSKTNNENVSTEKAVQNLLNVSPSNKENAPSTMENVKENFLDDSLEETQVFVYNKNPEGNLPQKEKNDFAKPQMNTAKFLTSTITSKPESNVTECQPRNDDDEMLEPTQLFLPGISYAKSDKSTNSTKINSTKNPNNKLFSSSQSLSLSEFDFDICTPVWDNLKLPTHAEIEEGEKLYNEMIKNQKREKQIFEMSTSSDSSDDDDSFINNKKKGKKSKRVVSKVADKINTTKKNKNGSKDQGQKSIEKNESKQKPKNSKTGGSHQKKTTKEHEKKINTEDKQSCIKVTRQSSRKNSERSTTSKNISESGGDKNKKQVTKEKHKTKADEKIPLLKKQIETTTRTSTRRLTSNDSNLLSHKNQKRGHDNKIADDDTPNNKKRKQEIVFSTLTAKPKIVFTKIDTTKYKSELKKLDAKLVVDPSECNILITEQVYWTWKFIAAVARGIPIVSPKWIEDAVKMPNNMPSTENYLLKDYEAEKKYNFNLKKSLQAAQKQPIFQGYSFLITPRTKPPVEELIKIIECGGGKILRKIPSVHQSVNNLYVVSDKDDMIMWHKIRKSSKNIQIIGTEGIMMSVLQQRITFKNYLLS